MRNVLINIMMVVVCAAWISNVAYGYDYEPQPDKATIMMIFAHPDDEGIFFGGVMAYYPQVLQVPSVLINMTTGSWMADHSGVFNSGQENKEPDFRECVYDHYGFPNEPILPFFQQSNWNASIATGWQNWSNGPQYLDSYNDVATGKQRASRYLAEQIRIYQPDVIIVQDLGGEYGHPDHRNLTSATVAAWDLAADNDTTISDGTGSHNISAAGIPGDPYQAKKMYIHWYSQNRLFHDYGEDVTIDSDGNGTPDKTPRQAVDGGLDVLGHASIYDVETVFRTGEYFSSYHSEWWGLYRTTVGLDTVVAPFTVPGDLTGSTYTGWARGDFLENITYSFDPATSPVPADDQVDAQLQWQPGSMAVQHDVYFGTDFTAVANAAIGSPEYMGRQSVTSFDPGLLSLDTTYYWCVDEVQSDLTVIPGQVWSFTTPSTSTGGSGSMTIYDFDGLADGPIDGQDNWANIGGGNNGTIATTDGSVTGLSGQHFLGIGTDSQYDRINDGNWSYSLNDTDILELSAVVRINGSSYYTFFGIGDADAAATWLAMVGVRYGDFCVRDSYADGTSPELKVAHGITTDSMVKLTLEIDPTGYSGAGSGTLYYENLTAGGPKTLVGGALANMNMGLTAGYELSDADTIYIRTHNNGTRMEDFVIDQNSEASPVFLFDLLTKVDAFEDQTYSDQITVGPSGDVLNNDSVTLTFSKLSGPDWLDISPGGALTGVPVDADAGLNEFTIRVTDPDTNSDDTTLHIMVNNLYDGEKGMIDFALFAQQWSQTGCGLCGGADLDGDSDVDMDDLSVFAQNWLRQ